MTIHSFRIAMFNELTTGPYARPDQVDRTGTEWLIVERSGPGGTILQVSDGAGSAEPPDGSAPADLTARNTLVGILAEDDLSDPVNVRFLFVRVLPPATKTDGVFFPADGYAELALTEDGVISLHAVGRHFHTTGAVGGATVLADVPYPAQGAQGGLNWHFDATRRPWINEV
ncbi:hypothetical protein GYB14_06730 [bacterium]|nr:hypothetical protein [bacterium]